MNNTTLDNTFLNRLRQIVETRYGKGLQIRQLMDLDGVKTNAAFTRGRDLHIPIQVNGFFLGSAVVPSADDLSPENKDGVTQLVRMALEPAMYNWYLERKESNLNEIQSAELELDNVELFEEDSKSLTETIEEENQRLLNEGLAHDLLTHIIHLEGSSETNNKKAALLLQEISGRWAFVPFNDIKGQLHSAQDIAKLGGMTVFVERLEDLNVSEQELLLEYIEEPRSSNEPLILTSSTRAPESIELLPRLLDEITINTFEVDRAPLNPQSLKDVLELFFIKDSPLDA